MPVPRSRTVPALLEEVAAWAPGAPALVAGGRRLDYGTLLEQVDACARGLLALGVRKGGRVAILMENRAEWIVADLAACSIGAIVVAVNTWVTVRELAYVLEHSDADTLVFTASFLKYDYVSMLAELRAAEGGIPLLRRFIHVGDVPYGGSTAFDDLERIGAEVPRAALQAEKEAVRPADMAKLLYTSGSTSRPKGVQLQHSALIENMWHIGARMHVTSADRLWLAVSLFWGFGCENALFNVLTHGACLVLQEHFDAGEALRIIEGERCTILYATPNMVHALLTHPDRARRDLSSLRSGGTFGTVEQMQAAVELGAREICQIYGLTEAYGNCNVSDCRLDPPDKRFASVGRALPGFQQRIVDPVSGAVLAPGATGEIQLRGHVTPGYYKDEALDRATFTPDGFFRTGDIGYLDDDGYLYIKGRLKEMIKTGGINVAPAEVEAVLMGQPGVKLAFVVGLPDPQREEVIGAVIVPRSGRVQEDALLAECRRQLATFKVPRRFCFVSEEELPLTTTGKVHRAGLPNLFARA